MGLMDFFRKKPAARQARSGSEMSERDAAELMRDLERPRCAHYSLAHYAMRMAAFEHPLMFLGVLASPDARDFLTILLRSVAEHCAERGEQPDFTVDDLRVHPMRLGGRFPAAMIEFPVPRAITEVHFVCAALEVDLTREKLDSESSAQPPLRYITLEFGFSTNETPRTVLCEWTAEGSHRNYGDGSEPTLDAFAVAVERMLTSGG